MEDETNDNIHGRIRPHASARVLDFTCSTTVSCVGRSWGRFCESTRSGPSRNLLMLCASRTIARLSRKNRELGVIVGKGVWVGVWRGRTAQAFTTVIGILSLVEIAYTSTLSVVTTGKFAFIYTCLCKLHRIKVFYDAPQPSVPQTPQCGLKPNGIPELMRSCISGL